MAERDRIGLRKKIGAGILGLALLNVGGKTQAETFTPPGGFVPVTLKPGETQVIFGPSIFKGDIVVDNIRYYDNDPKTGLVVEFPNGNTHTIYAPSGASGEIFPSNVDQGTFFTQESKDIADLRTFGCDPNILPQGCNSVQLVRIENQTPITQPTPTTEQFTPIQLVAGETRTIAGPAIIRGDVFIDGGKYHDDDPNTGSIVELTSPYNAHTVYAPYGAGGEQFPSNTNLSTVDAQTSQDQVIMTATGCFPRQGCIFVSINRIP